LSAAQFAEIRGLVYNLCGIRLESGKEGLVKSRLINGCTRWSLILFTITSAT